MMSLFLGLTLILRLVTDVLSDSYLKNAVFGDADFRSDSNKETAARWSVALIILSVVRKVCKVRIVPLNEHTVWGVKWFKRFC